jgi:nicotinamide/nicotinate riboside kinase
MIIGIGGASRSGKSILAMYLAKAVEKSKKKVEVIRIGEYAKPKAALSLVDGAPDWERPNTIKWDTVLMKIEKSTADVTIVEGLFPFYPASMRPVYDKKIFIDIERDTFEQRKSDDPRWEGAPSSYPDHVWKGYMKYGKIKGDESEYIFLDGAKPIDLKKLLLDLGL